MIHWIQFVIYFMVILCFRQCSHLILLKFVHVLQFIRHDVQLVPSIEVGAQLCRLSPVDARTVALKPVM